jgi:hypothetical protein
MGRLRLRHGAVVGLSAVLLAVPVAQVANAGDAEGASEPEATISITKSQLREMIRREVARRMEATAAKKKKKKRGPAGPPGAQGPPGVQGPAGTAPACQGNGSGDTMVSAGAVCIDRYEVSVWSSPTGGTQYGISSDDYPCGDGGQDCKAGTAGAIYARSVPGVQPSRFITWFQAQQAVANVGKRLPTNTEWQQAAAGTPDPGASPGSLDCNTAGVGSPVATGSRTSCVSNFGANDMVGNVHEWVGDWVPASSGCVNWAAFSDDFMCFSGASTSATGPGTLSRGGSFQSSTAAGPFAVFGQFLPQVSDFTVGFRGAR